MDTAAIISVKLNNDVKSDTITQRDYLLKLICKLGNLANPDHWEAETENEPRTTAATMERLCCLVKCLINSRNKTSKASK